MNKELKELGTRSNEQVTRNKEQGTRNKEQGTRNKEQETRNKEQGLRVNFKMRHQFALEQGTRNLISSETRNQNLFDNLNQPESVPVANLSFTGWN